VSERTLRSREIRWYCFVLVLCLEALVFLYFFIPFQCEREIPGCGGVCDCAVATDGMKFCVTFVIIGLYSVYRLYGAWRSQEGE
jgi:hypothetical protein